MRSEERFSRNAETDLVCRLLLEKKKEQRALDDARARHRRIVKGDVFVNGAFEQKVLLQDAVNVDTEPFRIDMVQFCAFFFFNDTATTEIYTLSLHDALPISRASARTFFTFRHYITPSARNF